MKEAVVRGVTNHNATTQSGPILVEEELTVDAARNVAPHHLRDIRVIWLGGVLSERSHITAKELQLGG